METAPLKNFATWARNELTTQVSARLTAVLAPASPERVESSDKVENLERAITAAGGGAEGKDAVADKVAYTWFNRIIALRFMDANGYTGIGVVSPAHGQQVGQPEILADAKRGNIDPDVVREQGTRDRIIGLLDGTRPSADGQGEAYTLLLANYCHFWNQAMPLMFESAGDYTELLIPANLLAADSILTKAVATLTTEVCDDVEIIGWLYQFYISERKDEVFASFKKGKKAGAAEIPAATQLFTPHWIVRYLVENSVGRLWMLNHPESSLIEQMEYYIAPVDEETDFLKVNSPEELTVIDPASGSGHMLTYAFDLLYAIYEEEGYAPSEIPELILTHNLYGTEIDQRAGALAAFALTMKARAKQRTFLRKKIKPNICVLDPISFTVDELDYLVTKDGSKRAEEKFWNQFEHADTFGSLIRPDSNLTIQLAEHLGALDAEGELGRDNSLDRAKRVIEQARYLGDKYSVVVANPPYMGSKQMDALLSQFMKAKYAEVKQDLYGAMVVRGIELANRRGLLAIIIGDTWMSIKSFEAMRLRLLNEHTFDSFVHMRDVSNHPDTFGANAAFVLSMSGNRSGHVPFIRLTPLGQERKEEALRIALLEWTEESGFHEASGEQFAEIPGSPIVYWLSEKMLQAFGSKNTVGSAANLAVGLQTGDNDRFLRQWWEVAATRTAFSCTSREEAAVSGARWFPHNKGGEFRRWYGNQEYVLNWENDGAELFAFRPRSVIRNPSTYFSPSVSWSAITSGNPSFRYYPHGFIPSNAGMACYASDAMLKIIISVVNSAVAENFLSAIAPTMNLGAGETSRVPMPLLSEGESQGRVDLLIGNSSMDWSSAETSWDFVENPLVSSWRSGVREKSLLVG